MGTDRMDESGPEDTFAAQIEAVQRDLDGKRAVDFNGLPRSGKQAVMALLDEQRARLATDMSGRLVVQRRLIPSLIRYLSLGALG